MSRQQKAATPAGDFEAMLDGMILGLQRFTFADTQAAAGKQDGVAKVAPRDIPEAEPKPRVSRPRGLQRPRPLKLPTHCTKQDATDCASEDKPSRSPATEHVPETPSQQKAKAEQLQDCQAAVMAQIKKL